MKHISVPDTTGTTRVEVKDSDDGKELGSEVTEVTEGRLEFL